MIHALEIIAYKHPDEAIKRMAWDRYVEIAHDALHLNVETEDQLNRRLG